jgi:DNA-binding transcriptional regulator YhcF (GntR family)
MNKFIPQLPVQLYIDEESKVPKYRQIIDSVLKDVDTGILLQGQRIPSINELSEEYYLARDTVEKAYNELRQRGIIESVRGKGYYIRSTRTENALRILMIFNKVSAYKKMIYNSFRKAIGPEAVVDLRIHHHSADLLHSFIDGNMGNYGYFVVMPHFYEDMPKALKTLRQIPAGKLLMLDKNIPELCGEYAAVYQDFALDIYEALDSGMDLLLKYKKLILAFPESVPYPTEIVTGFRNFCKAEAFDYEIVSEIEEDMAVCAGEAYVVIEETDLANLIKKCRSSGLVIGKDVGIVSFNDTPLKEILANGITVVSTDHEKMGEIAARMIIEKDSSKRRNPYALIRRNSL